MESITIKRLLLRTRKNTLWAFKPSLVSMGVILDEPMLITLEGIEGEGPPPTRFNSISYEDTSIKFQNYLLDKG